jgi:hypothetical protein
VTDTSFDGLDRRTERWLMYEQTVNERLIDTKRFASIDADGTRVRDDLRPERRAVWDQEVLWLPRRAVRTYGAVSAEVRAAFGVDGDDDRMPRLLHPQAPAELRRLAHSTGRHVLSGVVASPTASYRSVVAWRRGGRDPGVVAKLSLGAWVASAPPAAVHDHAGSDDAPAAVLADLICR